MGHLAAATPAGRPISRGDSLNSIAGSDGAPMYSRKDKSLGVLCENFLSLCQRIPEQRGEVLVSLDTAAKDLGVERRRVYDIVNVLECVEVVTRKQKNSYVWHGFTRMQAALDTLASTPLPDEAGPEAGVPKSGERREKSMAVLARKFLQVLLSAPEGVVSLEDTCRTLLGGALEDDGVKTKVRRLYDIANILSSLPLIEKTHIIETRKPAFKFLGVPTGHRGALHAGQPHVPPQNYLHTLPGQPSAVPNLLSRQILELLSGGAQASKRPPVPVESSYPEAPPMKRSRSMQQADLSNRAIDPQSLRMLLLRHQQELAPAHVGPLFPFGAVPNGNTPPAYSQLFSHMPFAVQPRNNLPPQSAALQLYQQSMTLGQAMNGATAPKPP